MEVWVCEGVAVDGGGEALRLRERVGLRDRRDVDLWGEVGVLVGSSRMYMGVS